MAVYSEDVQIATERVINLNAYTLSATTKIQFAVVNNWGYSTIIDDIEVTANTIQNDLALENLVFETIETAGIKNITGNIRNLGANVINSFDLNWSLNGGSIFTQNIVGLNLTAGQVYVYNHTTPWNATPGNYNISVSVTNVNGTTDSNTSNNSIERNISIASGSTSHKPLYEKFTSSTCPPCASFNNNVFNAHYANNNQNFTLINYQVNWPGAGDPYYTQEVGQRVQYYGINGAPSLLINGRAASTSNPAILNQLNSEIEKPAYFELTASSEIVGDNINIDYNI
jgi:hypothetical protein